MCYWVLLWHFGTDWIAPLLSVKSVGPLDGAPAGRRLRGRRSRRRIVVIAILKRKRTRWADILFLKHESSIFRQSYYPVCGFSMMEQVRLCAVWPMENWLGSSMNLITTGLNDCLRMLQACFRQRMSGDEMRGGEMEKLWRLPRKSFTPKWAARQPENDPCLLPAGLQ